MTITDYTNFGFELANTIKQSVIDRAESDVIDAYIKPLLGDEFDTSTIELEVCTLAYCLMLTRNVVKTRFSGEKKNNQFATSIQNSELRAENYSRCSVVLNKLKKSNDILNDGKDVIDIINYGYYNY